MALLMQENERMQNKAQCNLKCKAKKVVQANIHEFGPKISALNGAISQIWESSQFFIGIPHISFNTKDLSRDQILKTLDCNNHL